MPLGVLADLFVEMEQTLRVVGGPDAAAMLRRCWDEDVDTAGSPAALERSLEALVDHLAAIPHEDAAGAARVMVVGDFFTRFNPAFMEGVHDRYTQRGIILIPAGLNELFLYSAYSDMLEAGRDWTAASESLRTELAAGLRALRDHGLTYLTSMLGYQRLCRCDRRYRSLFRRAGLAITYPKDMRHMFARVSPHISPTLYGEALPTVGRGVVAAEEGFRGVIVIGPFNCLPFRISEAILKPFSIEQGIPILAYESDGVSVSPAFLREVDVHIQQVLGSRREPPEEPDGYGELATCCPR
jgi:predicted nucleotide-binding protein (sugar kinase/HSP70/actin superfamily)